MEWRGYTVRAACQKAARKFCGYGEAAGARKTAACGGFKANGHEGSRVLQAFAGIWADET